ncbi:MAG: hypothetical protein D6736_17400 [Nitrospinota bacterium]|nr:MAG: hypothetical protein D6736_17400 [Nitrospinota bacterium]
MALNPLDLAAQREILSIPVGKKKAFVYSPANDTIAVGSTIHAELAEQLEIIAGCAGFLERTNTGLIRIIHAPSSPIDAGGQKQNLPLVQKKLQTLGITAQIKRDKS